MKKTAIILTFALLAGAATPIVNARLTKDEQKEYKSTMKQNRAALKEKADKTARKEAKELKKAGWMVAPGALPLEKQLDKSYLLQMEVSYDGMPTYLMGEGNSTGTSYDAAKNSAIVFAKQNILQQMETAMTTITTVKAGNTNNQSMQEVVTAAKGMLSQELGRVQPVTEVYRKNKNGSYEALVRVAYPAEKIRSTVTRAAEESLGEQADKLMDQIDKMFEE